MAKYEANIKHKVVCSVCSKLCYKDMFELPTLLCGHNICYDCDWKITLPLREAHEKSKSKEVFTNEDYLNKMPCLMCRKDFKKKYRPYNENQLNTML